MLRTFTEVESLFSSVQRRRKTALYSAQRERQQKSRLVCPGAGSIPFFLVSKGAFFDLLGSTFVLVNGEEDLFEFSFRRHSCQSLDIEVG